MSNRSCRDCDYCHMNGEGLVNNEGACRRYAPRAALVSEYDDDPKDMVQWPLICLDDWCGEFTERSGDPVA